jgi:hypothetical protein
MPRILKSTKLDGVLYDVRGPVVDEAAAIEARGEKIIHLNIGNPAPFGFEAPKIMLEDMIEQLPETQGYSESHGLVDARLDIERESRCGFPEVIFGPGKTPADLVYGTVAAVQGDWVYYFGGDDDNRGIYRIKTDGSEEQMLAKGFYPYSPVIIANDRIYYAKITNSVLTIYTVKTDGSDEYPL